MLFLPQVATIPASDKRRGVVLLVVISLLSLFAAVGLGFVFYAEAESTASRYTRQGADMAKPDVEPEVLLDFALTQLIFDTTDEYSALRGHSLTRSMYGFNNNASLPPNTTAFNGVGRLRYPVFPGLDNYYMINYQRHNSDGFIRDPEFYGKRGDPNYRFVGGANVPWTYPDADNLFLGAINGNGEVLIQSFHRPWISSFAAPNPALQKYLQLTPHSSYHPLFTVVGADGGGHCKNLDFALGVPIPGTSPQQYYNNDSVFIDPGFPVMTARNGKRFKALFAFFITDLDGKVNLNATGNNRKTGGGHLSHVGLGPWEINPSKILTAPDLVTLFQGSGNVPGRYGADGQPSIAGTAIPALPGGAAYPYYSHADYDAAEFNAGNYNPSQRYALPGEGANKLYSTAPNYPAATYADGNLDERRNHPLRFNPFNPWRPAPGNPNPSDDRVFPVSNLEALLRYGGTGSPALGSSLFQLCPNSFSNAKARRLVTTHSYDLGVAAAAPWLARQTPPPGEPYPGAYSPLSWDIATSPYPKGGAVDFPSAQLGAAAAPGGEFGRDWRSALAGDLRYLINKPNNQLRVYPNVATGGRLNTNNAMTAAAVNNAISDRQIMAQEIYERLVKLTGARDPSTAIPPVVDPSPEYRAARWLAQLAVNMVDYIDHDDYLTPFPWHKPDPADPTSWKWVFGTELPRLVINEVYAQINNDQNDPSIIDPLLMKASRYDLNFFVELHNPFYQSPKLGFPRDEGRAYLRVVPAGAAMPFNPYRIALLQKQAPQLRDPANTMGDPQFPPAPVPPPIFVDLTANATAAWQRFVAPANGAYKEPNLAPGRNVGFYVVGPQPADPFRAGSDPNLATSILAPDMSIRIPDPNINLADVRPVILLQRLANEHLEPQPDPKLPFYNPYITVDYYDSVPVNDARQFNGAGAIGSPTPPSAFRARGRVQPYAAHASQWKDQDPQTVPPGSPRHTFYRHNAIEDNVPPEPAPRVGLKDNTIQIPFDWLVHLDRHLMSPIELLQVSGYRPHELTQQFMTATAAGAPQRFTHLAPWFDQNARIYRLFEFLDAGYRYQGPGNTRVGRIPGRININTIWDEEVFQALCDANAVSSFPAADVATIYAKLIQSRTPGDLATTTPVGRPSRMDRPFKSLATGVGPPSPGSQQYPDPPYPAGKGTGIDDTLFRVDPGNAARRLFEVLPTTRPPLNGPPYNIANTDHPYQRMELLSKIFNNVTTRSNVFAVWLTVGFFEVVDESVMPPRLGPELGRAEGRHIRHRMFAVIDRSNLTVPRLTRTATNPLRWPAGFQITAGVPQTIPVEAWRPAINGVSYTGPIGAGLTVLINDTNVPNNTEVVTILAVNTPLGPGQPIAPPNFTAIFSKNHNPDPRPPGPGGQIPILLPGVLSGNNAVFGHPGRQPNFNLRTNQPFVLYYSVIQ